MVAEHYVSLLMTGAHVSDVANDFTVLRVTKVISYRVPKALPVAQVYLTNRPQKWAICLKYGWRESQLVRSRGWRDLMSKAKAHPASKKCPYSLKGRHLEWFKRVHRRLGNEDLKVVPITRSMTKMTFPPFTKSANTSQYCRIRSQAIKTLKCVQYSFLEAELDHSVPLPYIEWLFARKQPMTIIKPSHILAGAIRRKRKANKS